MKTERIAPKPADEKWRTRRWQTYYESRSDYIKHLVQNISDSKALITSYDQLAQRRIEISDDLAVIIRSEKECLADYQAELQQVMTS
jgi:Arc/MetJ-type ribon-helix-helix transcriptional regulator